MSPMKKLIIDITYNYFLYFFQRIKENLKLYRIDKLTLKRNDKLRSIE